MLPPRCPNCGCAATGPTLHGTPLVLCPACWTVVDPTAPPQAPEAGWLLVETPEPLPLPDETPEAIPAPPAFDLSRLPPRPPRARYAPVFPRFLLFLVLLAVAPGVGYGVWLFRSFYPSF